MRHKSIAISNVSAAQNKAISSSIGVVGEMPVFPMVFNGSVFVVSLLLGRSVPPKA